MDNIYKIANNVNILAMGEATHGQSKITKLRIKIFKHLVKYYNYNVFVLEENYSCCESVNKYIKTGKGNVDDLLFNFTFPYKHIYMRNLIKWIRKWNISHFKNKIEFKGIDFQYTCDNKSKSNINKFIENLQRKKIDRDKGMFQIFMKFYDPSKKYFIYGHMGHLQKTNFWNYKWFGNYLFEKFSSNYYVIGNTFYYGSYLGIDENKNNTFSTIHITNKMTEKSNKLKNGLNINYCVDNFNKKNIYEGGAIVSSKNPMDTFVKTIIGNRFDSIFVINDEKPFKIIKY